MRFITRIQFLLLITLVVLLQTANGQRLYDAQRDAEAQGALKIVGDLQSGSLFDKQLKNLGLLAKRDMEASLAAARVRMRADINSFTDWKDVNCVVGLVNRRISQVDDSPEITSNLRALNKQIEAANKEFLELQRKTECKLKAGSEEIDTEKCPEAKPGLFDVFFEHAGDFGEIEDAVRLLSNSYRKHKNVAAAVDQARDLLDALETLYRNYKERMDQYNRLQGELMDIRLQLKKVALQTLQIQAQYLKNTLKIRARREAEEADIVSMIDDYEAFSVKYRLGFDRGGLPPCAPEEIRPSGHRGLPSVSSGNIEMDLRDLVAKVKYAESLLDDQKILVGRQEIQEQIDNQAHVNNASNGASPSTGRAGSDLNAERAKLAALTTGAAHWRRQLSTKLFVLHLAAAISARGEIPAKMATLRQAREDHAYSIRQSGIRARAYQLTVAGGVKRLALYHKGGIKPSKIAELVHTAATVAIPMVVAND